MSLVVPYQDNWPADFRKIREYIFTKVKSCQGIEHIGSTSIPAMVAKPIIDLILIAPPGAMRQTIAELGELEYRHQGDLGVPGREAFDYLPPHINLPRHHLYACYPDHAQIAGSLAFRDFLRINSAWRLRLSHLKLDLDRAHQSDRHKYMDGKRALVEEILRLARQACPQPPVYPNSRR